MELKNIENKEVYLKEKYPFTPLPKLTDKKICIHCDKEFTVGDYKVEIEKGKEYIICPYECGGTVLDWVGDEIAYVDYIKEEKDDE